MTIRKRLVSGAAANTLSIGVGMLLQLAAVPVLTSSWGLPAYGTWLMLTTIPTYFALTDLGFVQAATNDMTMRHARGDRLGVLAAFQSVAVLVGGLLGIALLVGVGLLAWRQAGAPLPDWAADHAVVLALLLVYSGVTLLARVLLAAFRSTGHYAAGTLIYDGGSLTEGALVLLMASFGGKFLGCVLVQLAIRLISMAVTYNLLMRMVPWLRGGLRYASRAELRRMVGPALSAMAVPTALAINLQGMVLVVGSVLSPAAAGMFVPVRTATRLFVQLAGIINRASMPELAAAYATGSHATLRRIVQANAGIAAALLVPGAIGTVILGPWAIGLWTVGHVVPPRDFLALMAADMVVHAAWFFAFSFVLAVNLHARLGLPLLIVMAADIALAIPAAHAWGLNGVSATMLAGDAAALALVVAMVRSVLRRGPDRASGSDQVAGV